MSFGRLHQIGMREAIVGASLQVVVHDQVFKHDFKIDENPVFFHVHSGGTHGNRVCPRAMVDVVVDKTEKQTKPG